MSPDGVRFPARGAPDVILEGEVLDGGGDPLVVSHPHPLHGGDMHHPVVERLWRAAAGRGFRSLRYNFRGVGRSTGGLTHRSPLPLGDLGGAIDYLGGGPLPAVGYSYGARTTLHAIHDGQPISRAVLVGLPTRLPANPPAMSNLLLGRPVKGEEYRPSMDLDALRDIPVPVLVIAGDRDPLVQPEVLREHGIEPVLVRGVNHFFSRRRGNQTPEPDDLDRLTERALGFLS